MSDEKPKYRKSNFAKKINIHTPVKVSGKMNATIGAWVTGKYDPDYPPMIHCYQKMGRDRLGANVASANELIEFYENVLGWFIENQAVLQRALDEVWAKRHKYKKLEGEMRQEDLTKEIGTDNVRVGDFRK